MEIEVYSSSGGTYYVKEFIANMPANAIRKVTYRLDLLEKHGIGFLTHSGYMKKLEGYDIYEIIIDINKQFYRILCVIRNGICWLIHMFMKKSNATPQREINTAEGREKDLDYNLKLAII